MMHRAPYSWCLLLGLGLLVALWPSGVQPGAAQGASTGGTVGVPADGEWATQCVDCPRDFGYLTSQSLQIDSEGHPHVAYGGSHLYYAWHDGAVWRTTTVDGSPEVGFNAAMALNSQDQPHIVYFDALNNVEKYAQYDGTSWHVETIASGDGAIRIYRGAALAVDDTGHPHISHRGEAHGGLSHTWHDGSAWQTEEIAGCGGSETSLALDGSDHPHINYFCGGDIKYAWFDGSIWHIETVDSYEGISMSVSLALLEESDPRVSYSYLSSSPEAYVLKYAERSGEIWQSEVAMISTEAHIGYNVSLDLDAAGHAHIGHHCSCSPYCVMYTRWSGEEWINETVDTGNGDPGSFALDDAGHPHLTYPNECDGDLRYLHHDGVRWTTELVDTRQRIGSASSMAVDSSGRLHTSYVGRGTIKHARHDGDNWAVETIASGGRDASLALDGLDRPHVVYGGDRSPLKYSWYNGTGWQTATLFSDELVGRRTSLVVDQFNRPHLSYYNSADKSLRYAWHDGVDWHRETVDGGDGDVGSRSWLALDAHGQPHIVYFGTLYGNLKYAWYDGTGWQIEPLDLNGDAYSSEVAFDDSGAPHVGYLDPASCDLYYTWCDGLDWQTEHVGNVEQTHCSLTSIALRLDRLAKPHIAYVADAGITYAYYDGEDWRHELVSAFTDDRRDSFSLALDADGQAHIVFSGWTTLLHAERRGPTLSIAKQATPRDGLRIGETLTYTLVLSGPGMDVRLWDPLPSNVDYVSGTLTPPAVYSATAVYWQGTLPSDEAQIIRFQVRPDTGGTVSDTLSPPILNTAWLTDMRTGICRSATVFVNSERVYFPIVARRH